MSDDAALREAAIALYVHDNAEPGDVAPHDHWRSMLYGEGSNEHIQGCPNVAMTCAACEREIYEGGARTAIEAYLAARGDARLAERERQAEREYATRDDWPGGISDGLTLPCGICGKHTAFDYLVEGEVWRAVAPENCGVICLPCLDDLAMKFGIDIAPSLQQIQFTGNGKTIVLKPARIVYYDTTRAGEES